MPPTCEGGEIVSRSGLHSGVATNRRQFLASAGALMAAGSQIPAVSAAQLAERLEAKFDRVIQRAMERHQIPGTALGVVRGDQTPLMRFYGVKSLNGGEP